jgi:hypothetical protein
MRLYVSAAIAAILERKCFVGEDTRKHDAIARCWQ